MLLFHSPSFAACFYCKVALGLCILNLSSKDKIWSQYSGYLLCLKAAYLRNLMNKKDNAGVPVFQTIKVFSVMHEPSLVLFNLQYLKIIQVLDDSILSLTIPKFPIAKMHVVGKLKGFSLSSVCVCGRDNLSGICNS